MERKGVFLAFFLGLSIVLFSIHPLLAADTIKVGIVDTYSGAPTVYTLDVLDGFKLAVGKINEKGGVLGKKIEYTTRDEKFHPAVGLSMAKELVMKEKVDLLMGTINSADRARRLRFRQEGEDPLLRDFCEEREDHR